MSAIVNLLQVSLQFSTCIHIFMDRQSKENGNANIETKLKTFLNL